jgi:hypothetical protein
MVQRLGRTEACNGFSRRFPGYKCRHAVGKKTCLLRTIAIHGPIDTLIGVACFARRERTETGPHLVK